MGILGIISGAFGAFRRDLIERVGWHEPGPGNDSDLTIRIRKLRKQIAFAPTAVCLTNVPTQWIQWVRQRMRWDRNIVKNRIRKHRDTFNLFHHNFQIKNFLSFLDTLFFTFGLALLWMLYAIHMAFQESDWFWTIIIANYCMIMIAKFFQITIALLITNQITVHRRLYLILPGMLMYRLVERFVRIFALFQELLFRVSYHDPFAPEKVRKPMPVY